MHRFVARGSVNGEANDWAGAISGGANMIETHPKTMERLDKTMIELKEILWEMSRLEMDPELNKKAIEEKRKKAHIVAANIVKTNNTILGNGPESTKIWNEIGALARDYNLSLYEIVFKNWPANW